MKIAVACPQCQKQYQLAPEMAGKRVKCAQCAAPFSVPQPTAKSPAPPQAGKPAPLPASPPARPAKPAAAGPGATPPRPKPAPQAPAGPPSFFEDELSSAPPPSRRANASAGGETPSAAGRAAPSRPLSIQPVGPKKSRPAEESRSDFTPTRLLLIGGVILVFVVGVFALLRGMFSGGPAPPPVVAKPEPQPPPPPTRYQIVLKETLAATEEYAALMEGAQSLEAVGAAGPKIQELQKRIEALGLEAAAIEARHELTPEDIALKQELEPKFAAAAAKLMSGGQRMPGMVDDFMKKPGGKSPPPASGAAPASPPADGAAPTAPANPANPMP